MLTSTEVLEKKVKEKGSVESKVQLGKMEQLDSLLAGQGNIQQQMRVIGMPFFYVSLSVFLSLSLSLSLSLELELFLCYNKIITSISFKNWKNTIT